MFASYTKIPSSSMSSDDVQYYREQLKESEELLAKDPDNKELKMLVESLSATVDKMESSHDSAPKKSGNLGRTCEVYCEGKWYNSVVLKTRIDEHGSEKVIVKLLGTEQAREYDVKDVKFLPRANHEDFPIGHRIQAIWVDDGLWYNAKIVEPPSEGGKVSDDAFHVTYDGFEDGGVPYLVQSDQIREPVKFQKPQKPSGDSEEDKKTYVTPAGYVIPENLKIDRAKDSEKVIEDKKRKIHQIKSQQRQEKYTEEISHNKSQWQHFQQRMHSRR